MNQYCYIYSYVGSGLGDALSIRLPEGANSCRIYYELKDNIVPSFTVSQNGTEFQPDPNGGYSVLEGIVNIDYVLCAETTTIPKTLQVVQPELREILVEEMKGGEKTGGQHSFSYLDTGDNLYLASTLFQGQKATAEIQVEIDLKRYQFEISQDQTLNIDKPEENQLRMETQIPIGWLNRNLKSCLRVELEVDGGQIQFDVDGLELRSEESKNLIFIPIQMDGGPLDLTQAFPVKAVLEVSGENRAEAREKVRLTQEIPEIVSQTSGAPSNLDKLSGEDRPVAAILAMIEGSEEPDDKTEITDAEVIGIGDLEGVALTYEADSGTISLDAGLVQRLRLLRSSKIGGEAVLRGTVYRNGVAVIQNLECPVNVSWGGSWGVLLLKCVLFLLLIIILVIIVIAASRGALMTQEFFSRRLGDSVRKNRYFLRWSVDGEFCEVTRNHGLKVSPTKVKLLFPEISEFRARNSGAWVELEGTKHGYRVTDASQKQLASAGIVLEEWNLKQEKDELEFRCEGDVCNLVYYRKRGWALPLVLTAVGCGAVGYLVYCML